MCPPGVVLPLLQQSVMFWNLGFSSIILRKKLAWQQIVGALAVVAGVCIAALPEDGGTGILSGVRILQRFDCRSPFRSPNHHSEVQGYIVILLSV